MAKMHYGCLNPHEFEVQFPYAITSVVYDPMALDINGDPVPNALAQVSLQCLRDGTRIKIPITRDSMALLPSPQQRALEHEIKLKTGVIEAKNAMLAELRAEIGSLKSSLAATTFAVESWQKHSDTQVAEVKRLETVCYEHWDAKCDTEKKWAAEASEHDNTKNQLKEVRTANGKLLDNNTCQASEIQRLKSTLELRNHQYDSLARTVRELQATGAAKEREEYSKALEQKDVQISQITKQAKEWKENANLYADQRDAALLREMALEAEKGLCPCKPRTQDLGDGVTATWMDYPLPIHQKPIAFDAAVTQVARERLGAIAQERLMDRVASLETRVTKLEEAEGFPMESCPAQGGLAVLAYMGGQWVKARKSGDRYFSVRTPDFNKEREWDLANQPTRWKPVQPDDPMDGYILLDKSIQVEEGDEYELTPGVWKPSGNWQCGNKSQGKAHRYRRKIK